MKIVTVLLMLALCASPAHADDWTGPDKKLHLAAGAIISAASMAAQDPHNPARYKNALLLGAGAGLAKEVYDGLCQCGTVSAKDFWVTALGAALGTWAGGRILTWQLAF